MTLSLQDVIALLLCGIAFSYVCSRFVVRKAKPKGPDVALHKLKRNKPKNR